MRILLVNPNETLQTYIPLGLAYLSALLKQHGHSTAAFDSKLSVRKSLEQDLLERMQRFKPDIVGITCREFEHQTIKRVIVLAKKFGSFVVLGGPFVTGSPDETISLAGVDAICIGEGEAAFTEVVDKMAKGKNFFDTKNFWFKTRQGKIIKNELRPFLEDLDSLPIPDRDVFLQESNKFEVTAQSSRGCPFNCTYCYNNMLRKVYAGKGKYVRFRSAENLIEEMRLIKQKYNPPFLPFVDDVFTADRARAMKFFKMYAKEIRIPFSIITRADMIDLELLLLLRKAGCESIAIGVESANDDIRLKVIKKAVTKETLIKAFDAARGMGIYTYAFNIIGSPNETEQTIWETIEFNKRLNPGGIQVSMMAAHKGSDMYNELSKKGMMRCDYTKGWFDEHCFNLPTISSRKIEAYHKVLAFYVYCPKIMYPAIDLLRIILEHAPSKVRKMAGGPLYRFNQLRSTYRKLGFKRTLKFISHRVLTVARTMPLHV